ncbi:hypothetical protein E4J89_09510 [Arthrobacter sp. CAU 1506]|uniref:hypothetical protein n=1 Tax=Arthrobacter sp. CAU 1506 TaxID=2560052 RepID=UPI0010ACDE8D|nr:hypothetical protein [Arthrobacter sp. CAU 1506]TJY69530.1 hypothetical protein E4J89_09510 [Arthrobacter sp. CAU 1506]
MNDSREAFVQRREELERLFREGGPRLEAYLRERAMEGIRDAYMTFDDAAQGLGSVIIDGHKAGMNAEEIQRLLDELANEAEYWAELPITVRLSTRHVQSIIQSAA